MKRKCLFSVGLIFGAFLATAASAQVSSDELSRTVYKYFAQNTSCPQFSCSVSFPKVTRGHRIEISNVSCSITTYASANVALARMHTYAGDGTIIASDSFVPQLIGTLASGAKSYNFNNLVFIPLRQGQRTEIRLQTDGNWLNLMYCTINGHMITLQ